MGSWGIMLEGFALIYDEIPYILHGIGLTLSYAFLAVICGFCGGTVLAFIRLSGKRPLVWLSQFYLSVFRGTPLLLQLWIIYFALPQMIGCAIPAFVAGLLAFSLNSTAYVSEIIRAGIQSVPKGQVEIAKVLGCSRLQIMRDIVLPQAFRNVLPSLINEVVDLLKESALVSTIGEADLLRRANVVASEHFLYLEPLLVAGACYYVFVLILTSCAKLLERRLSCSK